MGIRITSTSGGGSFKVKNQGSGGTFKATGNTGTSGVSDWIRPSDWLEMPTIGTQEFIGLLAITDDEANHIALTCAGNYTVDWGDGIIENYNTGVRAEHSYTYSSISNSTISSRGYKQVIVRVTPQAGQNLTTVNLQQQNAILAKSHTTGWLDISINGSNITSLSLGGQTVRQSMCERVVLGSLGAITSFASLFNSFHTLQSVSIASSSSVTNFSSMFLNCYSLQTIPLFNTALGTTFSNMFMGCYSLESIPLINTGLGTTFIQMFNNCTSLETIPLLNLASADDLTQLFQSCYSLTAVPLLNTASVRYFGSMFGNCTSLRTVPLLNTANGIDFTYMVDGCNSLQTVPLFNTVKGTNFTRMLGFCYSLQQIPNLNTASGSNFSNMLVSNSSIAKAAFQGTRYSISYATMCLSRNAVIDIFNGLGTAVGTPTITITTNPAFNAKSLYLSKGQFINWRGSAVHGPTQDVYVSAQSNYIYRQAGGSGSFQIDRAISDGGHRGMGTDVYGNVYCALVGTGTILKKTSGSGSWNTVPVTGVTTSECIAGDFLGNLYIGNTTGLYKQTAMTGSFVSVYTGSVSNFDISPFDGSIYVTPSGATGQIYKQTAGTGSFNFVQSIPYNSICCLPNGDVYASNGTLYKQTAGTGSFVSMGINTVVAGQMSDKSDGNLYAVGYQLDVYYTDFAQVVTPTDRLIATNKGWTIA